MATQTNVAVVAEKPSVARDIARVLNATNRGEGYLHGGGYIVTWAIGHLVALAQPHEIQPQWRSWAATSCPCCRNRGRSPLEKKQKISSMLYKRFSGRPRSESVVCATDAGREGELIFRYIYEAAGCDKPVQRLWISSLTPEAIRDGFARLKRRRSNTILSPTPPADAAAPTGSSV